MSREKLGHSFGLQEIGPKNRHVQGRGRNRMCSVAVADSGLEFVCKKSEFDKDGSNAMTENTNVHRFQNWMKIRPTILRFGKYWFFLTHLIFDIGRNSRRNNNVIRLAASHRMYSIGTEQTKRIASTATQKSL